MPTIKNEKRFVQRAVVGEGVGEAIEVSLFFLAEISEERAYAYKKGPGKDFYRSLQKQEYRPNSWTSLPVFLFQLQQQLQRLTLGIAGNERTP